jgi:hypothetical protein
VVEGHRLDVEGRAELAHGQALEALAVHKGDRGIKYEIAAEASPLAAQRSALSGRERERSVLNTLLRATAIDNHHHPAIAPSGYVRG